MSLSPFIFGLYIEKMAGVEAPRFGPHSHMKQFSAVHQAPAQPPIYPTYGNAGGQPSFLGTVGTMSAPHVDQRTGLLKNVMTREQANADAYGQNPAQPAADPIAAWRNEQHTYQWALNYEVTKGLNRLIVLMSILSENDLFPLVLMPLNHCGDELDISWSVLKFDEAKWQRLPEEGIGTYMTETSKKFSERLTRWGKCISIGRTLYKTPAGQFLWERKLDQLFTAMKVMMCHGVMTALMDRELIDIADKQFNDGSQPRRGVFETFKDEIDTWAIFNLQPEIAGLVMGNLEDKNEKQRKNATERSDALVLCRGVKKFMQDWIATHRDFSETGIKQGQTPPAAQFPQPAMGKYFIYESIAFASGDLLPEHDPMVSSQINHGIHANQCR